MTKKKEVATKKKKVKKRITLKRKTVYNKDAVKRTYNKDVSAGVDAKIKLLSTLPEGKAIIVMGVSPSSVCTRVYQLKKEGKTTARATIMGKDAVIYR